MRGAPNSSVITFHTFGPIPTSKGVYMTTTRQNKTTTKLPNRFNGKEYLEAQLDKKKVLQFKYFYPKGTAKTSAITIGNKHDNHISCNPHYTGHIPGYRLNEDVGHSRGAMVRRLAASQTAPTNHGEPLAWPGQATSKVPSSRTNIAASNLPQIRGNPGVAEMRLTGVGGTRAPRFLQSWEAVDTTILAHTHDFEAEHAQTDHGNLPSEMLRLTKPLMAPVGSKFRHKAFQYENRPTAAWLEPRAGQEIGNSFVSARSYAGAGRC